MAHKMNEAGDKQTDLQVDHLIHQHNYNMEHLNDKLVEAKERQEHILMEKLQAKKLRKERFLTIYTSLFHKKTLCFCDQRPPDGFLACHGHACVLVELVVAESVSLYFFSLSFFSSFLSTSLSTT